MTRAAEALTIGAGCWHRTALKSAVNSTHFECSKFTTLLAREQPRDGSQSATPPPHMNTLTQTRGTET